MSVTITLIPLALAAAGLLGGGGIVKATSLAGDRSTQKDAAPAVQVQTRMKDLGLLAEALTDIGAADIDDADGVVRARIDGLDVEMTRDADGVWQSRFSGAGRTDAALRTAGTDVIGRLDAAYALRVQQAVAARIRERADQAGFELTSETRDEDAVTMVLTVRNGG